MNFADKSDPTLNRHFLMLGALRDPFFRDDTAESEDRADAERRRLDALAAARSLTRAREARP